MRKLGVLSVILMMVMVGFVYCAGIPLLAVMDLENKSGWHGHDIGSGMSDMLVTELLATKKVKVIEREQLKKVMAEQQLGLSGMVTMESAAKIGKLLGCQYIITGSITEYGTSSGGAAIGGIGVKKNTAVAALDIRVIDTTSGQIVSAAAGKGSKSSGALDLSGGGLPTDLSIGSKNFNSSQIGQAVRDACKQAAEKIVPEIAGEWSGAVVSVANQVITISGGKNVGLAKGDVYLVIRKGEVMTDPTTGEELGSEDSEVGTIKVTEVMEKMSKAVVVKGEGFQRGDIVKKVK